MTLALGGVGPQQIGDGMYDIAVGFDPGNGVVTMIGYVIPKPGSWKVSTQLSQDQEIRVIASPNTVDSRDLTPWPRVTQGNWSGGEEQYTFIDPTAYWTSSKLETATPGHLRILGKYQRPSYPSGVGTVVTPTPGGVANDPQSQNVVFGTAAGAAKNIIEVDAITGAVSTGLIGTIADAGIYEILECPDQLYYSLNSLSGGGGLWNSFGQVGTDITNVAEGSLTGRILAYLDSAIWYPNAGVFPRQLRELAAPFTSGGVPGTVEWTNPYLEGYTYLVGQIPNGLLVAVSGVGGTLESSPKLRLYTFAGNGVPDLIGQVVGVPVDIRLVGGTTYLLCASTALPTLIAQPIVFAIVGSDIQVLADYRHKIAPFQATNDNAEYGRLDGDESYLYMSWPTIGTKRFDRDSGAIVDVGNPATLSDNFTRLVCAIDNGSFAESSGSGTGGTHLELTTWGTVCEDNDTGSMTTSYYDFNTPLAIKFFRLVEIDLNEALGSGASIGVQYQIDNQTGFPGTLTMEELADNQYYGFFPARTPGARIQLLITLTASNSGVSPDIKDISVRANLGRTWEVTLSCRRNQTVRNLQDSDRLDPQGLRGVQLLANLENVYDNAGVCHLYVPSPAAGENSATTGVPYVEHVTAVLQKYEWDGPGAAGPTWRYDEDGNFDLEGDVACLFTEDLASA